MDSTITGSSFSQSGLLQINVTIQNTLIPVENATVIISDESTQQTIATLTTNSSGQTEPVSLITPPIAYSLNREQLQQPYSVYRVTIQKPGFSTTIVNGSEILPGETSLLPVELTETTSNDNAIAIPPHTLYGDYPPKIPESETKPIGESGEIVLSRVFIPEYVIVHDGPPNDRNAKDYYVRYTDYIKNVVSSEIYATWPESTIYANTLAIQSFTLNRIYTEFYRSKGYPFNITSSTAYDQKWIYGRNIYANIDRIVDSIFANYLSRPGIIQPIFTSYCDGRRVNCVGLSQWGSMTLGEQGYSAIEILRYYYGNDIYINSTESIDGIPSSWPGFDLTIGVSGPKVLQAQQQLNRISDNFPLIPKLTEDGIYGMNMVRSVRTFQNIFNLNATGTIDYPTWYEISRVFVGVSKISEPNT